MNMVISLAAAAIALAGLAVVLIIKALVKSIDRLRLKMDNQHDLLHQSIMLCKDRIDFHETLYEERQETLVKQLQAAKDEIMNRNTVSLEEMKKHFVPIKTVNTPPASPYEYTVTPLAYKSPSAGLDEAQAETTSKNKRPRKK